LFKIIIAKLNFLGFSTRGGIIPFLLIIGRAYHCFCSLAYIKMDSTEQSTANSKPILAIDLDDTLAKFIPSLINFHNEAFSTELKLEDFYSYDFDEVWGGTKEETLDKMDKFFESDHFKNDMRPYPQAKRVLLQLKKSFDLKIVTSRQHFLEEATKQWLEKYFPGMFSEILFGNHYGRSGEKRSKPEMCQDVGAVALIDDSLRYAQHMSDAGIPCVLFGNYAWNGGVRKPPEGEEPGKATEQEEQLPPKVARAANWKKVRGALISLGINPKGLNQPRVVSVAASKNASFFASLAKRRLETEEEVVLRALEKAMLNAVDATQMLVRQNIATIKNTTTSFTELAYGRRSCLEVHLQRTELYKDFTDKQKEEGKIITDNEVEVQGDDEED